jgi:xylan 1,4-beta-xylosidase
MMRVKICLLSVLLSFGSQLICAQSQTGSKLPKGTFINPVIKGYFSDPSILREGEDYYAIMSSHSYYPGMTIWHSRDLVNWNPICYTLDTYMGSIWAPDLVKHGDTYYIYFTNKQFPGDPYKSSNYVMTAKNISGPWSKPTDIMVKNIDPGHVVDTKTGQRYVYMSGGRMARLSTDGLTTDGTHKVVYEGWPIPDDWDVEGLALEGPKFFQKDGYYYAAWAQGGTHGPPTSHMVIVARSKHVEGPWENSPYNPVVHTYNRNEKWWSKGHGTIFETHEKKWFVMYHAYENGYYNLGRQALIEPITWTKDGWPVLEKGADPAKPQKLPIKGATTPPYVIGDHLNKFRVGMEWWFHEEFDPARFMVEDKVLTLKAKGESLAKDSNPLLFNAGEHAYSVSVEIEKTPDAHAGLIVYYNEKAFAGIGVKGKALMRYRRGEEGNQKKHSLPDYNHFHLKLVNRHHVVTLFVSADGINWEKLQTAIDVSPYQHNMLYESKACLPGLFVSGKGEARFKNVKYEVLD